MIVRLSRQEEADCIQGANMRLKFAQQFQQEQKRGNQSAYDIDLLGIRGECAVAKVLQIPFEPFRLGVDTGIDLFIDDLGIDVKSRFKGKLLLFKTLESFKADFAVLTEAKEDCIKIVGFCSKFNFQHDHQIYDLGYGPSCGLPDTELRDISVLWRHLTMHSPRVKHGK